MKPRTLAVLLALVAGLAAFVWFYEREQPGSDQREALARRVLGVEHEQISAIVLSAGERTTELVRSPRAVDEGGEGSGEGDPDRDHWRLRRPIDFAADYWQADALARTLAELEHVRRLDDVEPAQVGLEVPRGRVRVELLDGAPKELRIGAEVPGSDHMIVAVEGQPGAFVVARSLWESVAKDAAEWRDKDLFAAEREEVSELTLERIAGADGAVTVRLVEDGDDFALAAPIADRADDDAVNALLRELTGLAASAFLDAPPPLAEIGLDPPRARLTVTLDQGEPFVLLWGAAREGAEESYAKVGDLVVTTTAALEEAFERTPAQWRSRAWLTLPVFEIDEVTVTDAAGTITVTRDEGSWRRGEEAIQYGPVSDFLYALDDAVAERIAAPGELAAPGEPALVIELAAFEEPAAGAATGADAAANAVASVAKRERLELRSAGPDGLAPARVSGREAVLLLRGEIRDLILAKLEAVRAAPVAGEEAAEPATAGDAASDPEP